MGRGGPGRSSNFVAGVVAALLLERAAARKRARASNADRTPPTRPRQCCVAVRSAVLVTFPPRSRRPRAYPTRGVRARHHTADRQFSSCGAISQHTRHAPVVTCPSVLCARVPFCVLFFAQFVDRYSAFKILLFRTVLAVFNIGN